MEIAAFLLPLFILIWPLWWLARKLWRAFALLFLAALISGCASTSNKFDKSPCACDFELLDTANQAGQGNA